MAISLEEPAILTANLARILAPAPSPKQITSLTLKYDTSCFIILLYFSGRFYASTNSRVIVAFSDYRQYAVITEQNR